MRFVSAAVPSKSRPAASTVFCLTAALFASLLTQGSFAEEPSREALLRLSAYDLNHELIRALAEQNPAVATTIAQLDRVDDERILSFPPAGKVAFPGMPTLKSVNLVLSGSEDREAILRSLVNLEENRLVQVSWHARPSDAGDAATVTLETKLIDGTGQELETLFPEQTVLFGLRREP